MNVLFVVMKYLINEMQILQLELNYKRYQLGDKCFQQMIYADNPQK